MDIKKFLNTDPGNGWIDCPVPYDIISFVKNGLHVLCSYKENGNFIHFTITQIKSFSNMSSDELNAYQKQETPFILQLFFGENANNLVELENKPPAVHYAWL